MTVTEIPAATYAADLERVQELCEQARRMAVSDGTHVSASINVHCPTAEAVDCAAAEWGVDPQWSDDGRQYFAQSGNWRINLIAVHIPPTVKILCATDAEVAEIAARWGVRPRLNGEDGQYEARRPGKDGRTPEIAYCPLAEDEALGSAS